MSKLASDLSSPPKGFFLVGSGDDDDDLAKPSRAISFAVDGDISVIMADGTTATIPSGSLLPGMQHPMRVKRIKDTGTTATGIISWY